MAKAKARKKDRLDELAEGDPRKLIALILWRERHRNPELSHQITERDIQGFEESCAYMGVTPDVAIVRPEGRPAQEAIPAGQGKRGVAARPAEPPRSYVFVGVVEKGTMNSVKPIENNEDDARRRDEANLLRRNKDRAAQLSGLLITACTSGTFSTSEITEAAQVLSAFSRT